MHTSRWNAIGEEWEAGSFAKGVSEDCYALLSTLLKGPDEKLDVRLVRTLADEVNGGDTPPHEP